LCAAIFYLALISAAAAETLVPEVSDARTAKDRTTGIGGSFQFDPRR
jgi:hypothetical protein